MKVAGIICILCVLLINIEVLGQRQRSGGRQNDRNNEGFRGQRQGQRDVMQERGRRGRNQNNHERPDRRQRGGQGDRDHNYRGRKNSPKPVITEQDIMESVCNHCRQKKMANCNAVCVVEQNPNDHSKVVTASLGDSFCYFCENYRFNFRIYQMCRNRLCASGRK